MADAGGDVVPGVAGYLRWGKTLVLVAGSKLSVAVVAPAPEGVFGSGGTCVIMASADALPDICVFLTWCGFACVGDGADAYLVRGAASEASDGGDCVG